MTMTISLNTVMTMTMIMITVTAILIKTREKRREILTPPRCQALSCSATLKDHLTSMRSV